MRLRRATVLIRWQPHRRPQAEFGIMKIQLPRVPPGKVTLFKSHTRMHTHTRYLRLRCSLRFYGDEKSHVFHLSQLDFHCWASVRSRFSAIWQMYFIVPCTTHEWHTISAIYQLTFLPAIRFDQNRWAQTYLLFIIFYGQRQMMSSCSINIDPLLANAQQLPLI